MIPLYMSAVPREIAERFIDCSKQVRFENDDDAASALHLEYVADTHAEMQRVAEGLKGISVMCIGVRGSSEQALTEALSLGEACRARNRDHYIVYILSSTNALVELTQRAHRVTGVVLPPWDVEHILQVERKITNDYRQLGLGGDEGRSALLAVKYQGSLLRLNPKQILYLEAQNKKLEIHQSTGTLSVYERMETMRDRLGAAFFQCHRSFLVNREAIYRIDLPQMEIELVDGTIVPISRSSRKQAQELCEVMLEEETASGEW